MNTEITTSRTPYDLYNPENKNRAVFETAPASPSYYSTDKGTYFVQNSKSDWVEVNRSAFKNILVRDGYRAKKYDDELVSPLDAMIQHVTVELRLDLYGVYAGHKKGLMASGGNRILVTKNLPLIEPKDESWSNLFSCISGIFGAHIDDPTDCQKDIATHQTTLFFLWLRRHLHALYKHSPQQSPALVLCGPAGAGKSFLILILEECLGGRKATPFDYMSGNEKFNKDLFGSALWHVDDQISDIAFKGRAEFKTHLKRFTSQDSLRCRGMHSDAIEIVTHKALVICTNESTEALQILPEPEPKDQQEVWDKIILLKCFSNNKEFLSKPTDDERKLFGDKMKSEIPAMVYELLYDEKWEIQSKKDDFQGSRWPIKSWQNPEIMELLHETTPEDEIFTCLLRMYDPKRDCTTNFEITFEEFFERAMGSSSRLLAFQQDKIQRWAQTPKKWGNRMAKIASRYPKAFEKGRVPGKGNTYYVFRPNEL